MKTMINDDDDSRICWGISPGFLSVPTESQSLSSGGFHAAERGRV